MRFLISAMSIFIEKSLKYTSSVVILLKVGLNIPDFSYITSSHVSTLHQRSTQEGDTLSACGNQDSGGTHGDYID